MKVLAMAKIMVLGLITFSVAGAKDYTRSCKGGLWITYHSDAYHFHTVGWLNGRSATATARSRRFEPGTLRGRARDRFRTDCFQNLSCSGEMEIGGRMVNMSQPWPYGTTFEALSTEVETHVCQDARLNFRDVRAIRAQFRITGDVNCGMSDSKNFYADFLTRGNPSAAEVICSGRYPR